MPNSNMKSGFKKMKINELELENLHQKIKKVLFLTVIWL